MEKTSHSHLTRRAGLALLAPLAAAGIFGNQALAADPPQLLFVQSAADVVTTADEIRLKNANALTLFFSDRPKRIAGHYKLEEWGKLWTEGKDSFLKDHPMQCSVCLSPAKRTQPTRLLNFWITKPKVPTLYTRSRSSRARFRPRAGSRPCLSILSVCH